MRKRHTSEIYRIFGNRKSRKQFKLHERTWNKMFWQYDHPGTPHNIMAKSSSIETLLNALAVAGDNIEKMVRRCCLSIRKMAFEIKKRRNSWKSYKERNAWCNIPIPASVWDMDKATGTQVATKL